MTKILYNRAAKTFMDAISAGFDEQGAYAKVEKKHGKVLADAVYADAHAEMKATRKNPREAEKRVRIDKKLGLGVSGTIIEKSSESADIWLVKIGKNRHYIHGSDILTKNPRISKNIEVNKQQLYLLLDLFDAGGEFGVSSGPADKDYQDLVNKKLVKKLIKGIHPRATLTEKGKQLIKEYAKKHKLLEF